ncbi:MAG: rhomboid family intramembrane serine protease [Flavobacteriales bacterium]|nr:rhomboid family intramembrane serine protease [Flavobacteriales bacterium]
MSITDDIRYQWRSGGMLKKLLIVNIAVFLAIWLVELLGWLFNAKGLSYVLLFQLMGTSDPAQLLLKPWTPLTYMFTHQAPMHLFWNMVMFWFSGQIFRDILGDKRLLGNYLLGGLAGYAFYALGALMPAHLALASNGPILGASAAVMSVFIGVATYRPDMLVNLFLLGPVRLQYVALAVLALDLIAIRGGSNTGGHLAHLGGALYGFLAARQLRQGTDWSGSLVDRLERIRQFFRRKRGPRMRVEKAPGQRHGNRTDADFNLARKQKQERIDAILDKISRSGYDSLSKAERDFLFKSGNEQ